MSLQIPHADFELALSICGTFEINLEQLFHIKSETIELNVI